MAAAGSKTTAPAPEVSEDDFDAAAGLIGNEPGELDEDAFAGADDLLDEVDEDDAEGWNPSERGESLAGVITKISETRSDFAKPGEDPMVPTVTIQNREGKFRVIGFASVLNKELSALLAAGKLVEGNLFAVKYWGEKVIRRGPFAGKNYKHYSVVAQPPKVKG